jgi:hypothetical protein
VGRELFGKCRLKAKLTRIVPRWMASATHGWWYPEHPGAEPSLRGVWESSTNQLLPMGYQGKDGLGTHAKCTLCKVYRANTAPAGAYALPGGGVIGGTMHVAPGAFGPAPGHGPTATRGAVPGRAPAGDRAADRGSGASGTRAVKREEV